MLIRSKRTGRELEVSDETWQEMKATELDLRFKVITQPKEVKKLKTKAPVEVVDFLKNTKK